MSENKLSVVEAELYDRQIRLWGIESQEKLRAANVLLINIRGLGSEIAKNILLSGINSLTILDEGIVTEEELNKNFLLSPGSVGKKIAEEVLGKAQALNPLVKISVDTTSPITKESAYLKKFTIVVATSIRLDLVLKLDKVCRANKIQFIYGDVFGLFGFCVADFQEHECYEDQVVLTGKKRNHDHVEPTTNQVKRILNYPGLKKVLILPNTKQNITINNSKRRNELFFLMLALIDFKNKHDRNPSVATKAEDIQSLKDMLSEIFELYQFHSKSEWDDSMFEVLFDQVVPVSAVLGGVIAQEVIKAVSHKEIPINNVFIFDPFTYNGKEESVGI